MQKPMKFPSDPDLVAAALGFDLDAQIARPSHVAPGPHFGCVL